METCETSNNFANNGDLVPPYDVYALEYSNVFAKRSWWGVADSALVGRYAEDVSFALIDPVLSAAPGTQNQDTCPSFGKGGGAPASFVEGADLPRNLEEVARLRVEGRTAEATSLLASALTQAESEAEVGALVGAAVRVIARAEDDESMLPLRAWADGVLARDAATAPWAQRLLVALALKRGASGEVQRFGQALLRSDGTQAASHKLFALQFLVEQAVREGREERAREWIASASMHNASAASDLRQFVDVAFQRASTLPPQVANASSLKGEDAQSTQQIVPNGAPFVLAPNPASTYVRLELSDQMFAIGSEATVKVFDALGRVVLARPKAGLAQRATLDVRHLPSGVYMVRVVVVADNGVVTSETGHFTLSR